MVLDNHNKLHQQDNFLVILKINHNQVLANPASQILNLVVASSSLRRQQVLLGHRVVLAKYLNLANKLLKFLVSLKPVVYLIKMRLLILHRVVLQLALLAALELSANNNRNSKHRDHKFLDRQVHLARV